MSPLTLYWFVPWLRKHIIEQVRHRHVSLWSFKRGDVVCLPWCSTCGAYDHVGVILRVKREAEYAHARVRFACKRGDDEVGTLFLKRVLPPYAKEVLDLQLAMKRK